MDLSSDHLEPVELLADNFMERQRLGQQPTMEEYCANHPELADEIREVFPALVVMEQIAPVSADLEISGRINQSPEDEALEQVGDYRILREVGRGGMGVVYEAEQQSLGRRVALKVLPRQAAGDAKSLMRFQREARAAAKMHHTNIVPVFEVGQDNERVFYAMQLIQGQGLDLVISDLQQLRSEHTVGSDVLEMKVQFEQQRSLAASLAAGRFEPPSLATDDASSNDIPDDENPALAETLQATHLPHTASSAVLPGHSEISTAESNHLAYFRSVAEIGLQTARALSYAHARGIIHRDIKPSNLILDTAGIVWVTDFGLAKTSDSSMTHTGDILGTLRYMSPERFKGQCDVRADVYSLGLTLYEMLLLKPAFQSPDRLKLIDMVAQSEAATPRSVDPRIPRDLETIVLKASDKDPRRRYQSADDLAEDLQRFVNDEPIRARRISSLERLGRWSRRNKALAASLFSVATLITCVAIGSTIFAGHIHSLYAKLGSAHEELADEKQRVDEIATQNKNLAEDNAQRADDALQAEQQAVQARDEMQQLQQVTRRNLYAAEINMAQLAGQTGAFARREELLSHWRTNGPDTDLRGFEYYHLLAEGHEEYLEIQGYGNEVISVAWSPDGKRVAMGGEGGAVHVCDAAMGDILFKLRGHQGSVIGVDWNPDGSALVSSSVDHTLRIWDAASGQQTLVVQSSQPLLRVAWSPDGKRVAAGSVGAAIVWDAQTGRQLVECKSGAVQVMDVDWNRDGKRLATVDTSSNLVIWDTDTGQEMERFDSHAGAVTSVSWHPDGERLATCATSGECYVWKLGQSDPVLKLDHDGSFAKLDWSPDGERLALAYYRQKVCIFSPSGELLRTFRGHDAMQSHVEWSPDSRRFATSSYDRSVRIWRLDDTEQSNVIATGTESLQGSAWSPDGRYLALGKSDGRIELREMESNQLVREFVDPEGSLVHVSAVQFIENGTLLAAGGRLQNEVLLWATDTGSLVRRLAGPPDKNVKQYSGIRSMAWDAQQRRLAAGTNNGHIVIWDPSTGEQVQSIKSSGAAVSLAFIPGAKGRWLVSGHGKGQLRLWDLSREEYIQEIMLPAIVNTIDVNESEQQIAAAGGTWGNNWGTGFGYIQVMSTKRHGDLMQLENQLALPGPENVVQSLKYSEDGARLIAGGADGSVYVWDTTGDLTTNRHRRLLVLDLGKDYINTVNWSPDGTKLIAGKNQGDVHVWNALDGYKVALSPKLLPTLDRMVLSGTATANDYLLRARILARQANWSAAAMSLERLSELGHRDPWFVSDLWLLDGAYPEELSAEYPPEQIRETRDFDVLQPVPGADVDGFPERARWLPQPLRKNVLIDLGKTLNNRNDVNGYALVRVYAQRDQDVGILIGADDNHRLWLNGKLIDEDLESDDAEPDENAFPATLNQGWNTLLVKVKNIRGPHGLFLSLSDDPVELAPLYDRSGKKDAAAKMWDRAVAENPNSPMTIALRGNFLWKQGQRDRAEQDFQQLLSFPFSEIAIRRFRSRTFERLGRDEDALVEYDRILELDADQPVTLGHRCDCNMRLGNLEAAANDLQAMIAINPTDYYNYFQLSSLLLKIGEAARYEKLRWEMLSQWESTKDLQLAERICKACLLLPAEEQMLTRLDAMMTGVDLNLRHPFFAYYLGVLGMLEYRQGEFELQSSDEGAARKRFQAAMKHFNQARSRGLMVRVRTHYDLFAAMSMHRLDRTAPARDLLEAIEVRLAGNDFTQPGKKLDTFWHDEFMPQITYQEAAQLIRGAAYLDLVQAEQLILRGETEAAIPLLKQAIAHENMSDGLMLRMLDLLDWDEVAAHLQLRDLIVAANAERTDDPLLLSQAHIKAGSWKEAALDIERHVKSKENATSIDWMKLLAVSATAVTAGQSDISEYHRLSREMIELYHDSKAGDIERTLKSCLLLGDHAAVDRLSIGTITTALHDGTIEARLVPWFHAALGLRAYRQGDYSKAIKLAGQSHQMVTDSESEFAISLGSLSKAISSLAHTAQGKTAIAADELKIARDNLGDKVEFRADGSIQGRSVLGSGGNVNHDHLISALLIREAERALQQASHAE